MFLHPFSIITQFSGKTSLSRVHLLDSGSYGLSSPRRSCIKEKTQGDFLASHSARHAQLNGMTSYYKSPCSARPSRNSTCDSSDDTTTYTSYRVAFSECTLHRPLRRNAPTRAKVSCTNACIVIVGFREALPVIYSQHDPPRTLGCDSHSTNWYNAHSRISTYLSPRTYFFLESPAGECKSDHTIIPYCLPHCMYRNP